jgi:hypothetical protein
MKGRSSRVPKVVIGVENPANANVFFHLNFLFPVS